MKVRTWKWLVESAPERGLFKWGGGWFATAYISYLSGSRYMQLFKTIILERLGSWYRAALRRVKSVEKCSKSQAVGDVKQEWAGLLPGPLCLQLSPKCCISWATGWSVVKLVS